MTGTSGYNSGYDWEWANTSDDRGLSAGTWENGIFTATSPWNIRFPYANHINLKIGTSGWIGGDFIGQQPANTNINANNPLAGKIFLAAGNNRIKRVIYKVIGTAPNRYAYFRYEAYMEELGYLSFETHPIIWEVSFPENASGINVYADYTTFPASEYNINIIKNSRYGTYAPGFSAFCAPVNSGTQTQEVKIDLSAEVYEGNSFKITMGPGALSQVFTKESTINST